MSIIRADARQIPLADESVNMVVCSPPYWSLRDYQTGRWEGGAGDCDHRNGPLASSKSTLAGYTGDHVKLGTGGMPYRDICGKCGARRIDLQIGLERSIDAYIQTLVAVFDEVRRVLHPSGVCFVNIADSYAGSGKGRNGDGSHSEGNDKQHTNRGTIEGALFKGEISNGLKPKDLCLIPERLAIALQSAGWWIRSRIAWCKPAPMPESVNSRPTSAWEHLWVLAKNASYFWDAEAVREITGREMTSEEYEKARQKTNASSLDWAARSPNHSSAHNHRSVELANVKAGRKAGATPPNGRNLRNWWVIGPDPSSAAYCVACDLMYERSPAGQVCVRCRGKLTAHYAAYPRELVRRCIAAGSSERGVCAACLTPWVRVTEVDYTSRGNSKMGRTYQPGRGDNANWLANGEVMPRLDKYVQTVGWRPQCSCFRCERTGHPSGSDTWVEGYICPCLPCQKFSHPIPALILDPFSGTGTTLLVARDMGRRAVGLELSWEYCRYSMRRLAQGGLFTMGAGK